MLADGGPSPTPISLVIITDPGKDLDDEMALIMLSALWKLGMVDPRCVVTNLHPAAERATLARGTLDVLGLQHVPVGCGTDGGDRSSPPMNLPSYAPTPSQPFPSGAELLDSVLQAAEDHSLTLLLISSLRDAADLLQANEPLFVLKVNRVVVMGGVEPEMCDGELRPDQAHNNEFDPAAAAFFYKRVQGLGIQIVTVTRRAAYTCRVERQLFDTLAASGCVIGKHLQSRQQQSIQELWSRTVGTERFGLPARCDKQWFCDTFCGGSEEVMKRGCDDSIWDLVETFNMYDTLALLACIPSLEEQLFSPVRCHVRGGVQHLVIGMSDQENGIANAAACAEVLEYGYGLGLEQQAPSDRLISSLRRLIGMREGGKDADEVIGVPGGNRFVH